MSKFNLSIQRPDGFMHSSGFLEFADSIAWSLSSLGHDANITQNWLSETGEHNIIFGAELLADFQRLPKNSTIFNLEQPSHPNMDKVKRIVKESGVRVWDYSLRSVEDWKKEGFSNVYHVPVGYTPNLTRIPAAKEQDIDVLFYGWETPRRTAILESLRASGLNVYSSSACYGGGRDQLISRAKICLNVHHDNRDRFEAVRCSYLMANAKCVVTEVSSDDDEYPDLASGLCRVPYRLLVDTCCSLVKADTERWNYQSKALAAISGRDLPAAVAAAIGQLPDPSEPRIMVDTRSNRALTRTAHKRDYLQQGRDIRNMDLRVEARYHLACQTGDMKDFAPWLRAHAKGNIVEIGVRDGASTSAFLSGLELHGGHLWSIDVQPCGDLFEGHPQWSFLQCDSKDMQTVIRFIPFEVDVLLIDGDHSRAGVINDIEYARQLRPGGIVIFHDIDPEDKPSGCSDMSWPGDDVKTVYWSLVETMGPLGWTHEEPPGKYGLGVLHKPAPVPTKLPDLSWYPSLPESMTEGKSPEEIEATRERIRNHTMRQVGFGSSE